MWINVKKQKHQPVARFCPQEAITFALHPIACPCLSLTPGQAAEAAPNFGADSAARPRPPRKGTEVSVDTCHQQGGLWPSKTDRRSLPCLVDAALFFQILGSVLSYRKTAGLRSMLRVGFAQGCGPRPREPQQ